MASARRPRPSEARDRRVVDRVQTGVRIERRILQVLKALASSKGMSVGDMLEGIILHAFEGAAPFGPDSLQKIAALREVYGLDVGAADSHLLVERSRKGRASRKG
jgi:hypothetical protein